MTDKMDDLTRVVQLQKHSNSMRRDDILAEIALLRDPIFSARMMEKVTGVPLNAILPVMGKTARTGGRLNPETLPVIWQLREYGYVEWDIFWCIDQGTSQHLLARLTGISETKIHRANKRRNQ